VHLGHARRRLPPRLRLVTGIASAQCRDRSASWPANLPRRGQPFRWWCKEAADNERLPCRPGKQETCTLQRTRRYPNDVRAKLTAGSSELPALATGFASEALRDRRSEHVLSRSRKPSNRHFHTLVLNAIMGCSCRRGNASRSLTSPKAVENRVFTIAWWLSVAWGSSVDHLARPPRGVVFIALHAHAATAAGCSDGDIRSWCWSCPVFRSV
jgi:hypothetical protein